MTGSSHIKNTFKHALVYGSAGLIGKAVGFIMLPIYAHHLQAEGYGVIGMIDTVLSFLTLLIGYGISGAMSRFYYETDDSKLRNTIVSTTVILMFFLVVGVTLPVLVFSKQVAWLAFGHKDWGYYILLSGLSFIASMTSKNAENYILILQQSVFLSIISLIRLAFSLFLNIYFIVTLRMGVLGFLYASLIDAVVYSLFMHAYSLIKVGVSYDNKIAKDVLRFSLPMLPGYIAMFLRGNADRVILRAYLGLATVGVFEMLYKFATLIGFFVVEPFSKIWQVKRFEVCDLEEGPSILARVFTYHTAVMLLLALIFSLEIPVVLRLLTPREFWLSGFIVYFAVMSRVLNGSYYHFFFGLLYAKKTWNISVIQIGSAIGSLIITIPLILKFGLSGAVLASFLSQILQCILGFFMAQPYYQVPYAWGDFIKMNVLMTCLFWAAKDFTIVNTPVDSWMNINIAPLIKELLSILSLDQVRNGKLVLYLVDGLPHVIDGTLFVLYSGLFLIGLVFLRVIPMNAIGRFFSFASLRKPINNLS